MADLNFVENSNNKVVVEWKVAHSPLFHISRQFALPAPHQDKLVRLTIRNDYLDILPRVSGSMRDTDNDIGYLLQLVKGGQSVYDFQMMGKLAAMGGSNVRGPDIPLFENLDDYRAEDQSVTLRFTAENKHYKADVPMLVTLANAPIAETLSINNVFEVLDIARRLKQKDLENAAIAFLFEHRKQLSGTEQFIEFLQSESANRQLVEYLTSD